MGRRFLLSAIAVGVIASVASAGTLKYTTPEVNVSKEWTMSMSSPDVSISLGDFNYTATDIKYQTLTNPVINITFNNSVGVKTSSDMSKVYICEIDKNGLPVDAPARLKYDSTYKNVLIFKALNKDQFITNGKSYGFFYDINESNCSQMADGTEINATNLAQAEANSSLTAVTLDKNNPQNVTTHLVLATGDSQEQQDVADGNDLVAVKTQFCAGVSTPFDATIDPAKDFLEFTGGSSGGNCLNGPCTETKSLSDSLTITIASDKCREINNTYQVQNIEVNVDVLASNALNLDSKNPFDVLGPNNTSINDEDVKNIDNKEFKYTFSASSVGDSNVTTALTLNLDGKVAIPVTNFTASLDLTTKNLDKEITETLLKNSSAGSWTYNASSASIPYIVANGDTQTAIRVINPSAIKGDVYWTCTDDNGVTVSNIKVKSADTKSVSIPASGAAAWLARDILAAAQAKNPDFAPNGKMTCTVYITNSGNGINLVPIMTINGARDRVIPTSLLEKD